MKLHKVAQRFNRTPFSDPYTNCPLGYGQLDTFNDSMRDGMTVMRRVFEVAPDITQPERGVIEFHNTIWLVGLTHVDSFRSQEVRHKWVIHQAEGLAGVYTPTEILRSDPAHRAYASRVWEKTNSEIEIRSARHNQISIYFARAETLERDSIIEMFGTLYTVMAVYPSSAGHQVAVVEQLDAAAVEQVDIGPQTWSHSAQAYIGTPKIINILRLRWQSDFEYFSQASETFQRGDMQVLSSEDVASGSRMELSDGAWQVVAGQRRNDVWYLHLRRLA